VDEVLSLTDRPASRQNCHAEQTKQRARNYCKMKNMECFRGSAPLCSHAVRHITKYWTVARFVHRHNRRQ
jgi:hypothetical protein